MNNKNSHNAFALGVAGIIAIIIFFSSTVLFNSYGIDDALMILMFLFVIIVALSIIGTIKSIKGLKEPNTPKKIIGMILNFGIITLFVAVIIASVMDIYRAFN